LCFRHPAGNTTPDRRCAPTPEQTLQAIGKSVLRRRCDTAGRQWNVRFAPEVRYGRQHGMWVCAGASMQQAELGCARSIVGRGDFDAPPMNPDALHRPGSLRAPDAFDEFLL